MRDVLSILFVVACVIGCAEQSVSLPERAEQHFRAGEFALAIESADQQLTLMPNDTATLLLRGKAKTATMDFRGAIADLTRVIESLPNDAEAFYAREIAHRRAGETDLAAADGTRARQLDPLHKRAYAFDNSNFNRSRVESKTSSTPDGSTDEPTPPPTDVEEDSYAADGFPDIDRDTDVWNESDEAYAAEDREYAEIRRQQKSAEAHEEMVRKDMLATPVRPDRAKPAKDRSTVAGPSRKPKKGLLGGPRGGSGDGKITSRETKKKPVLSTALPPDYTPSGNNSRAATGLRVGGTTSVGNPLLRRGVATPNGLTTAQTPTTTLPFRPSTGLQSPYTYRPGPIAPRAKGGIGATSPQSGLSTSLDHHGVAPQGYTTTVPTTGTPNQRPTGRRTITPPITPPITTALPNR